MGTVAIGIGIGIGIGLGSVETVLHILIEANFIGIGIGVSVRIGVRQWKHTITRKPFPWGWEESVVFTALVFYFSYGLRPNVHQASVTAFSINCIIEIN